MGPNLPSKSVVKVCNVCGLNKEHSINRGAKTSCNDCYTNTPTLRFCPSCKKVTERFISSFNCKICSKRLGEKWRKKNSYKSSLTKLNQKLSKYNTNFKVIDCIEKAKHSLCINTKDFVVYSHHIHGENSPFYIGSGSVTRAFSDAGRNPEWYKIVKDNSGNFEVKILLTFNNRAEAYNTEMSFIIELKPIGNIVGSK